MKVSSSDLLQQLPGPVNEKWPTGERFVLGLAHGSMTVELYAPLGVDPQSPHIKDELYLIHSGTGTINIRGDRYAFAAGDCFFVAAGAEHKFEDFSLDFSTWAVFWGPDGGEPPAGTAGRAKSVPTEL